jgi:SET domain-containing protein
MTRPPKSWPTHVQYSTAPYFHSSVSGDALSFLKGDRSKGVSLPSASPSLGQIRAIVDPSHPAHGQHGLFATKKIPPQTLIVEYIGEVHSDERPTSDYDISLYRFPGGENVGVDAATMGNEARFVNDYRGIRPKPNAQFADRWTASGDLRMGIWSLASGIRKGDEIVVSYGKSWWAARTLS